MKRIISTCLIALSVFAFMGCTTNHERAYKYSGFKAMLNKKNFKHEETKALASITTDGVTKEITYTYDPEESGRWVATYIENDGEDEFEITTYQALDIKDYVSTLKNTIGYKQTEVDQIYKFYVIEEGYKITMNLALENGSQEGELKFNSDGLCFYAYSKMIINQVEISEETTTYTYSK